MPADGGSIYDRPAARAKHRSDFVLHRQHHAANIDVADLSIMLDGLLGCEQSDVPFAAGIVEGNMQGAEGRDRLLDQGDDVLLPTDICLDEEGLSAGRGDLADNIFSFRNAAARDNDVCAVPGKGQCSCFADAGGASGDDYRLILECFHGRCLA
jgi:hypothetical protein